MFDLSNIKLIRNDDDRSHRNYSFVGIRRNEGFDKDKFPLEFWLPIGFDEFNKDFDEVKSFFFKMYRTFKTYLQRKQDELKQEDITINKDGIIEKDGGFSFVNENKEQSVFYGKINSLEKIIEGYDELRISSLEKKQIRSHEIDYSKLHRYMHQAVFLVDDDIIYLDEMNIAKNVIIKSSPPILQMFCFIYAEIKKELDELDTIPLRAVELSEQFKEEHLQLDSQLFGENTFIETVNILREKLEIIDIETTYKDEDYWHFFEAIEAFLYGERQEDNKSIYWGFNSFYDIWEDMCQCYALENEPYKSKAIFYDLRGRLENPKKIKPNPFELSMNNVYSRRYIRPDLVLREKESKLLLKDELYSINQMTKNQRRAIGLKFNIGLYNLSIEHPLLSKRYFEICQEEENFKTGKPFRFIYENDFIEFESYILNYMKELAESKYRIIDYKYMRQFDFERYTPISINEDEENKIKDDIHKQLIYEWTIQQNCKNSITQSEFWIPFYPKKENNIAEVEYNKNNIENDITEKTSQSFKESQIKLKKINFKVLQEHYIKQSFL